MITRTGLTALITKTDIRERERESRQGGTRFFSSNLCTAWHNGLPSQKLSQNAASAPQVHSHAILCGTKK
jgi:hypothetical protein